MPLSSEFPLIGKPEVIRKRFEESEARSASGGTDFPQADLTGVWAHDVTLPIRFAALDLAYGPRPSIRLFNTFNTAASYRTTMMCGILGSRPETRRLR
jgi:hypothetical protein